SRGWSPEVLADKVPVSNMTWRRLLAKADAEPLPAKYRALLSPLAGEGGAVSTDGLDPVGVVLSGMQQTRSEVLSSLSTDGAAVARPRQVLAESGRRLRSGLLPSRLVRLLRSLRSAYALAGRAGQALILGGLVYFLNPFDLIADSIVSVGLVDDLGVLSLIHARLGGKKEGK
ncbi:MAG: hypothetical protein RL653_3050, partial [Pseudomonadota bacterium]